MDPFNVIDMMSVLPLGLRAASLAPARDGAIHGHFLRTALLGFVPVLRTLKLLRRFEKFHLVWNAFRVALEALPVLLYTLSVIVLFFSALIFIVEPRENIPAIPEALWLVLVSGTTVGYGDKVPVSSAGKCCVCALIVTTSLYMAVPLGIVGNAFSLVWEDRARLLLVKRTRDRLVQWGYGPKDMSVFFRIFSRENEGQLNFEEFTRMITKLNVGISELQVYELYANMDVDGTSGVTMDEFVYFVFREDYVEALSRNVQQRRDSTTMTSLLLNNVESPTTTQGAGRSL